MFKIIVLFFPYLLVPSCVVKLNDLAIPFQSPTSLSFKTWPLLSYKLQCALALKIWYMVTDDIG